MKGRIYLDTSVISALFDGRTPERMELTKAAWKNFGDYDVYISNIVIDELKNAPQPLLNKMLLAISEFSIIESSEEAHILAAEYVKQGIFPSKYYDDALHVAIASTNQISILLSWNFTHLVKIKTRKMVALVNTMENYIPVEIISPPEL